jgi:hypothetical protein
VLRIREDFFPGPRSGKLSFRIQDLTVKGRVPVGIFEKLLLEPVLRIQIILMRIRIRPLKKPDADPDLGSGSDHDLYKIL